MTDEIVIKLEVEETPAVAAPVVVVIPDTPAPAESALSEADAIELAELRREKQERLEVDTAAALMAANLALEIVSQEEEEEEVIVPSVEEESKEEEKPDTPPDRTHAFFREF